MLAIFFWYMFEPATLCPIWLHLPYVVLFLVCFCSILTEFVCLVYISIHIELLHWGHVSTRTCIMSFYRWLSSLLRLQVVATKLLQIVITLCMPNLFNVSLHIVFIFICFNCILISSILAAYVPLLLSRLQCIILVHQLLNLNRSLFFS